MKMRLAEKDIEAAILAWFDNKFPGHPTRKIDDRYNIPYELTLAIEEDGPDVMTEAAVRQALPSPIPLAPEPPAAPEPLLADDDSPF